MTRLNKHRHNDFSQWGEDGILREIFRVYNIQRGTCVEFGAWDGQHLSNTAALLLDGWSGVLIEGDPAKYVQLVSNFANNPRVGTVNRMVGLAGDDTLDAILQQRSNLPQDFTLLSIDVDGCDYHIWATVEAYRPAVVVVEFNPTIPLGVGFVQPRDMTVFQGSSLSALMVLGETKAYVLVACTDTNAIFVKTDLMPHHHFADCGDAGKLWVDRDKYVTQIFSLYDGTVKLTGAKKLPWHGVTMDEEQMQVLPASARKFSGAP